MAIGKADIRVAKQAKSAYGLITRAQAARCGLSEEGIEYRLRVGRLERLCRGVYRLAGVPQSWHQRLLSLQMSLGPSAVVSHSTAAALHEFPGFPLGQIEFLTPIRRNGRSADGVLLHRTKDLQPADVTKVGLFVVTNASRTLVDLASVVKEEILEGALDEALRRRLTTTARLEVRMSEFTSRRRTGMRILARLVEERKAIAPTESVLEDRFLRLVRRAKLPVPVTQHPIFRNGRQIARVDFAFLDCKIAIECDGHRYHSARNKFDHDARRERALVNEGWRVYRFTWRDIVERPSRTIDEIRQALSLSPNR